MATEKQRAAARRNVKKAQKASKEKRTVANLPTCDALRARQGEGEGGEAQELLVARHQGPRALAAP